MAVTPLLAGQLLVWPVQQLDAALPLAGAALSSLGALHPPCAGMHRAPGAPPHNLPNIDSSSFFYPLYPRYSYPSPQPLPPLPPSAQYCHDSPSLVTTRLALQHYLGLSAAEASAECCLVLYRGIAADGIGAAAAGALVESAGCCCCCCGICRLLPPL